MRVYCINCQFFPFTFTYHEEMLQKCKNITSHKITFSDFIWLRTCNPHNDGTLVHCKGLRGVKVCEALHLSISKFIFYTIIHFLYYYLCVLYLLIKYHVLNTYNLFFLIVYWLILNWLTKHARVGTDGLTLAVLPFHPILTPSLQWHSFWVGGRWNCIRG